MPTPPTRWLTLGLTFVACFALIAPAARAAKAKGPVQVFILAGQSNMEGKALASTLEAVIDDPKTHDAYKQLKPDGKWAVRRDVWVTYLDKEIRGHTGLPLFGPLTVGFGSQKVAKDENNQRQEAPTIGPELGIGWMLGDHFDQQVLLIKAAWGGRAVKYTFRPPSAMPSDEQVRKEFDAIKARKPDADVTYESYKAGYGSDYRKVISETHRVIDNIGKYFPGYDAPRGYEIAGFIWFQGWNDGVGGGNPDYVDQMAHFIRDMRRDLKAPNLPFVIGELGTDGPDAGGWVEAFRQKQAAIAALPEFKGNVALARTAQFWPHPPDLSKEWAAFRERAKQNEQKPKDDATRIDPGLFYRTNWEQKYKKELAYTSDKRYHYLGSGACYYQMGESMGRAMLTLLK
jgi:Carbohydrate esterase, sialic acid-specific acetylesterase